jgi:hypothetical protein
MSDTGCIWGRHLLACNTPSAYFGGAGALPFQAIFQTALINSRHNMTGLVNQFSLKYHRRNSVRYNNPRSGSETQFVTGYAKG